MRFLEHRVKSSKLRLVLALTFASLLGACSGSDGSGAQEVKVNADQEAAQTPASGDPQDMLGIVDDPAPTDSSDTATSVPVQDESAPPSQSNTVTLVVDSTQRCAGIFEPIDIVIARQLDTDEELDPSGALPNVTSLATFEQRFGTSLSLVSVSDESANFEMVAQDIVGLTASIEGGSVTTFLAAYDKTSAPENFIMQKPTNNGCLYAFKSVNYCVAGLSTTGNFRTSRNGLSMSAVGCELDNPNDMPVIEILP